jgi:hypothetical protein
MLGRPSRRIKKRVRRAGPLGCTYLETVGRPKKLELDRLFGE